MEPSIISESFHTARSSLLSSTTSSSHHSSYGSTPSVASTVRPTTQQQPDNAGNAPSNRSPSIPQQNARHDPPEINLQTAQSVDHDETISHLTSDTMQAPEAYNVRQTDIFLCAVTERESLTDKPKLQKAKNTFKFEWRLDWKEMEVESTASRLSLYTTPRVRCQNVIYIIWPKLPF